MPIAGYLAVYDWRHQARRACMDIATSILMQAALCLATQRTSTSLSALNVACCRHENNNSMRALVLPGLLIPASCPLWTLVSNPLQTSNLTVLLQASATAHRQSCC